MTSRHRKQQLLPHIFSPSSAIALPSFADVQSKEGRSQDLNSPQRNSSKLDQTIQSSLRQSMFMGKMDMPECYDDTDMYNLYAKYGGRKVFALKRYMPHTSDRNALETLKHLGEHRNIAYLHGNHNGPVSFICFVAAEYTLRECFDHIPWNEAYIHKIAVPVRRELMRWGVR